MFDPRQFTALYHEYLESGLTVRNFCTNRHLRESKFYYWKNRLKSQLPPKKGFVPVVFENEQKSPDLPFSNSDSEPAQELIKFASCKLPGFL